MRAAQLASTLVCTGLETRCCSCRLRLRVGKLVGRVVLSVQAAGAIRSCALALSQDTLADP